MKKTLFTIALGICSMAASAQEEVSTTISADVVSKYVFRGMECGKAAIQPTLGVEYKGLSLSAWGSYGITEASDVEEFDLTLAYSVGNLTVGVTDYWFSGGADYLHYSAHETAHVFEANVGYDFGVASLNWYTNFAGADGCNKDGKRAYSSYVEANVPFSLGGASWDATIGAVPYATSFYQDANGFAVTNVSLKATADVKLSEAFSLPIFASITVNPSTEKAFFNIGATISLK